MTTSNQQGSKSAKFALHMRMTKGCCCYCYTAYIHAYGGMGLEDDLLSSGNRK